MSIERGARPERDRRVRVCALLIVASACAQPPADRTPHAIVYATRMGLATWHQNSGCLAVFNDAVATGTVVTLVQEPGSTESPSVTRATVAERLAQACDRGLAHANNSGHAPSFYQLTLADSATEPTDIVFAILDAPASVVVLGRHVEADLDGDGVKESFRLCTSHENVHFMVWTGVPGHGTPRWHGYYYVPYDLQPTCTEQDEAGMVAVDRAETR